MRSIRLRNSVLLAVFGAAAGALATPPLGFLVNQIVAMGPASTASVSRFR